MATSRKKRCFDAGKIGFYHSDLAGCQAEKKPKKARVKKSRAQAAAAPEVKGLECHARATGRQFPGPPVHPAVIIFRYEA